MFKSCSIHTFNYKVPWSNILAVCRPLSLPPPLVSVGLQLPNELPWRVEGWESKMREKGNGNVNATGHEKIVALD